MKTEIFNDFKEKGAFTLTEERIHTVSNHISEDEPDCYTKKEAAECAKYWSLSAYYKQQDLNAMRDEILLIALRATNEKSII